MIKNISVITLFLFFKIGFVYADANTSQQQILKSFDKSIQCWNNGDLKGFMNAYLKSDNILYISGTSFLHGWQNSYQHYIDKYGKNKQNMGQLQVKIESIQMLDQNHAFAYGRYHLKTSKSTYDGVTSLIFEKHQNEWKIIIDHSNS